MKQETTKYILCSCSSLVTDTKISLLIFIFLFFESSAENESTPIQQLLEHFLRQLQR